MLRLRVKEVAQAKGYSMAKLQRQADIDLKTLRQLWHQPFHNADFNTLNKIAKVLKVPATDLLEDVEED